MKKQITSAALLILVLMCISATYKSSGPPSCYAGEPPGNKTCATAGCHDDGTVNSGAAQVILDLDGAENGYIPGATYTINIQVSKIGMTRAGFQFIVLQDNLISTSPGTITLTNTTRTQKLDKTNAHSHDCPEQEKTWVEHTFAGTSVTSAGVNNWSFQWKAPDSSVGSITFYLAALEANNNGEETGDQVYTRKQTVSAVVGVNRVTHEKSIQLFPNPVKSTLQISTTQNEPLISVLYNSRGEKITQLVLDKTTCINTEAWAPGLYLITFQNEHGRWFRKFVKE